MEITTSPAAQWATEGTEYPYLVRLPKIWQAHEITESEIGSVVKFRNLRGEDVHGVLTAVSRRSGQGRTGEGGEGQRGFTALLTVASDQSTTVHALPSYRFVAVA